MRFEVTATVSMIILPEYTLHHREQCYSYVGFEIITAVIMKSIIFWNKMPWSPLSVNRGFGGTYSLHLQGRRNKLSKKPACQLLACWFLAELISSTLKMEAICSSETSVDTQRTTRRHIPNFKELVLYTFLRRTLFSLNPDGAIHCAYNYKKFWNNYLFIQLLKVFNMAFGVVESKANWLKYALRRACISYW
jgi:hypothetical protein